MMIKSRQTCQLVRAPTEKKAFASLMVFFYTPDYLVPCSQRFCKGLTSSFPRLSSRGGVEDKFGDEEIVIAK